jgi:hypothetical protein
MDYRTQITYEEDAALTAAEKIIVRALCRRPEMEVHKNGFFASQIVNEMPEGLLLAIQAGWMVRTNSRDNPNNSKMVEYAATPKGAEHLRLDWFPYGYDFYNFVEGLDGEYEWRETKNERAYSRLTQRMKEENDLWSDTKYQRLGLARQNRIQRPICEKEVEILKDAMCYPISKRMYSRNILPVTPIWSPQYRFYLDMEERDLLARGPFFNYKKGTHHIKEYRRACHFFVTERGAKAIGYDWLPFGWEVWFDDPKKPVVKQPRRILFERQIEYNEYWALRQRTHGDFFQKRKSPAPKD